MTPSPPAFDWEAFLDRLAAFYHTGDWRVPYLRDHAEDPFQVLIGTILSQRTRDENTDRASQLLFAKYPDAARLARATRAQIEPLIHSTGFYHTKARVIHQCARLILDRFDGVVPHDLEQLTSLPGVGPKTANCVLVFGYGIPGMPVDTHVHRISNRLGVVRTRTPEQTETALRQSVPERYWIPVNPLMVQHGQNLCRPNRPRCPECPVIDLCATGIALRVGRPPPRKEDARRPARRKPAPTRTPASKTGARKPRR
ncbi:MAG: endonuclease III [Thermoplasmata archaeon]|nr:endonuclease III [Thermoplasmata archaeon]